MTTADLFDGYIYPFATDAEEHFFTLMASQGETAYLWNRLGNLYFKSRRADLAMAALERSLSLDANLMESDFTIGMILVQSGAEEAGARYLRQALVKAAHYEGLNANDLRDLLAHALIELAHVHVKSGRAIAMLPSAEEWAEARNPATDAAGHSDSDRVLTVSGRSDDPTIFYPLAEEYLSPAQLQRLSDPSLPVSRRPHKPSVKKPRKRRR
jgi:tetratricopeptide (TPR) repeat protein